MNRTRIAWTESTSNPLRAINTANGQRGWFCTKISPGCAHCYSERINCGRFGNRLPYIPESVDQVEWIVEEKEFQVWSRRKTPTKIFVGDMIDLFHPSIPEEMVRRVFEAMLDCPWHTFQVLTKRPDQMNKLLHYAPYWGGLAPDDIRHIWLGVSVENQHFAQERIPLLLQMPAVTRFLSCEPLLGPLSLELYLPNPPGRVMLTQGGCQFMRRVDWVICGGESGPGYRRMDLDWARGLREQCRASTAKFFFKQESGPHPGMNPVLDGVEWHEFPARG